MFWPAGSFTMSYLADACACPAREACEAVLPVPETRGKRLPSPPRLLERSRASVESRNTSMRASPWRRSPRSHQHTILRPAGPRGPCSMWRSAKYCLNSPTAASLGMVADPEQVGTLRFL